MRANLQSFPKPPAWQIARLCARPDSVNRELEQGGSLVECEDRVDGRVRSASDVCSAYGKRPNVGLQAISEELADEMLLGTAGRIGQPVEGGSLTFGQPHE